MGVFLLRQPLKVRINPVVAGLQRPTLGPVRNFNQVNGTFIQILHTPGNAHWVCVGSVGCEDGTVNLYDNLYHNIIERARANSKTQHVHDQQIFSLLTNH